MNLFQRDRGSYIRPKVPRPVPGGDRPPKVFNFKSATISRRRGRQSVRNRYAAIQLLRRLSQNHASEESPRKSMGK